MTQQQFWVLYFPQPQRSSKRTWVIYLNIHWHFRKPETYLQGICMGLAGMTKDLWKTSVFQSDRWETGRVFQPSSYRTRHLFLGNWRSWELAHSWSHLNTGARGAPMSGFPPQSVELCHWRQDCYSGTRSRSLFQKKLSGALWIHWHGLWGAAEVSNSHLSTQRDKYTVSW